MKYGFVIDNRKCIGCHACTVACKSEHDVPVGVNRTFVKQTEKGVYPNTKRLFSVMRCNHCTEAPCVEICPVECLHIRPDGIVDFNTDRCIGCKSCMQACPYDALYIDPDSNTAAKCNYCAHRIDIGLEPACVNVCPEHAIISGDMDNQESEISQLISRENVMVRKPEKGTMPNVFYINGDEVSLTPGTTERTNEYIWSSQSKGVGHFSGHSGPLSGRSNSMQDAQPAGDQILLETSDTAPKRSMTVLMEKAHPRRVYDSPDKGVLWGWEVSGYIFTKAIAAGVAMVLCLGGLLGYELRDTTTWLSLALGLGFLIITGVLLVMDLDRPDRFLYVLLRPQWNSWLVRGGYAITIFGASLVLWGTGMLLDLSILSSIGFWGSAIFGLLVAIYTAFLFSQAKGRDFWQSPTLSLHMLVHSFIAGSSALIIGGWFIEDNMQWSHWLGHVFFWSIMVNLVVLIVELSMTHPTEDANTTALMIVKGMYSRLFWIGTVIIGNLLPLTIILVGQSLFFATVPALIGIWITEKIWVEAPQRLSLT